VFDTAIATAGNNYAATITLEQNNLASDVRAAASTWTATLAAGLETFSLAQIAQQVTLSDAELSAWETAQSNLSEDHAQLYSDWAVAEGTNYADYLADVQAAQATLDEATAEARADYVRDVDVSTQTYLTGSLAERESAANDLAAEATLAGDAQDSAWSGYTAGFAGQLNNLIAGANTGRAGLATGLTNAQAALSTAQADAIEAYTLSTTASDATYDTETSAASAQFQTDLATASTQLITEISNEEADYKADLLAASDAQSAELAPEQSAFATALVLAEMAYTSGVWDLWVVAQDAHADADKSMSDTFADAQHTLQKGLADELASLSEGLAPQVVLRAERLGDAQQAYEEVYAEVEEAELVAAADQAVVNVVVMDVAAFAGYEPVTVGGLSWDDALIKAFNDYIDYSFGSLDGLTGGIFSHIGEWTGLYGVIGVNQTSGYYTAGFVTGTAALVVASFATGFGAGFGAARAGLAFNALRGVVFAADVAGVIEGSYNIANGDHHWTNYVMLAPAGGAALGGVVRLGPGAARLAGKGLNIAATASGRAAMNPIKAFDSFNPNLGVMGFADDAGRLTNARLLVEGADSSDEIARASNTVTVLRNERVYEHVDEFGNVNYYGISIDLPQRAGQHRLDVEKTGDVMRPISDVLTHDEARTIEAMLIRDRIQWGINEGLIDGTEPVLDQLEAVGLLNKNRGRIPERWVENIDLDDYIQPFEEVFDIRTPT
ncbi:MAG: hypothetical protein AAF085_14485, partial [Planctomycetota bacterium]